MRTEDFLLELYCLIDQMLREVVPAEGLRQRGPAPKLSDAEVITLVAAGEFMGIDTDKALYRHFRAYHAREFPALLQIDRTTLSRQAANLGKVMAHLQDRMVLRLPLEDPAGERMFWLIDSFPVRVCRLARAPGCRRFAGVAGYGYDPTAGRDRFYGFRAHVRCADSGPCAQLTLAAANVSDLSMVQTLIPPQGGLAIGDRNYWCGPDRREPLAHAGLTLLAPYRKRGEDPTPQSTAAIMRLRKTVEVVIGQLAERFHAERTWARDMWHLTGRLARKLLSHTTAVFLNLRHGNPPLQLDRLLDL